MFSIFIHKPFLFPAHEREIINCLMSCITSHASCMRIMSRFEIMLFGQSPCPDNTFFTTWMSCKVPATWHSCHFSPMIAGTHMRLNASVQNEICLYITAQKIKNTCLKRWQSCSFAKRQNYGSVTFSKMLKKMHACTYIQNEISLNNNVCT